MKIFAYIGSYRKKSSFSYHVVDNLIKNIADANEENKKNNDAGTGTTTGTID